MPLIEVRLQTARFRDTIRSPFGARRSVLRLRSFAPLVEVGLQTATTSWLVKIARFMNTVCSPFGANWSVVRLRGFAPLVEVRLQTAATICFHDTRTSIVSTGVAGGPRLSGFRTTSRLPPLIEGRAKGPYQRWQLCGGFVLVRRLRRRILTSCIGMNVSVSLGEGARGGLRLEGGAEGRSILGPDSDSGSPMRVRSNTHTNTCTRARTHTRTHMRTHAHTHIHTKKQVPSQGQNQVVGACRSDPQVARSRVAGHHSWVGWLGLR